jgi:hypothetical protein
MSCFSINKRQINLFHNFTSGLSDLFLVYIVVIYQFFLKVLVEFSIQILVCGYYLGHI